MKKNVIKERPKIQPALVHNRWIFSFRLILSNLSVGGKTSGVRIVRIVKLIVGADNVSTTDLNVSINVYKSFNFYNGPDIPPSFRIRQKCTAINIIIMNGIAIQCKT